MPVYSIEAEGTPSPGKAPKGRGWQDAARRTPPAAALFTPDADALNTGILCDGLRAVDIDCDNQTIAHRLRAAALERWPDAPLRTRAGSPRCLLVLRAAEGEPPKRVVAGTLGKVEVLGRGQQFVAFGMHPSGAALEWPQGGPGDVSLESIPAVTEDELGEFLDLAAPMLGAKPAKLNGAGEHAPAPAGVQAPLVEVIRAVSILPNVGPPDWEAWNRIGLAMWAATNGSAVGRELWHDWSRRNACYDAAATDERWNHYRTSPPVGIGAGTLFRMAGEARRAANEPPPAEPDAYEQGDRQPHSEDAEADDAEPARPEPKPDPDAIQRLRWTHFDGTMVQPRQWAFGTLLQAGRASMLAGNDGVGKGAFCIGVAASVATGIPFLGERVWRSGSVGFVSYEDDREELQRRIAACALHHGLPIEVLLRRLVLFDRSKPIALGRSLSEHWSPADGDQLVTAIRAEQAVGVIIDPLAAAHDGDENSNTTMVHLAREADRIAQQSGAWVIVVQHLRKGAIGSTDDIRGASGFRASLRTSLVLSRMTPDEAKNLEVPQGERFRYVRASDAKMNYSPPPGSATWFRLASVPLGNGAISPLYPMGDSVQAIERWHPPSPFAGISWPDIERILGIIRAGAEDGLPFAADQRATHWVGKVISGATGKGPAAAAAVIKTWIDNGVLLVVKGVRNRNPVKVAVLNEALVAEMLAKLRPSAE